MKSFIQYISEAHEEHPHFTGSSKPDDAGVVTHTYTDSKLGVRTRLFTRPDISGSAYWGFQIKNKEGDYTQDPPKAGDNAPKGRLRSALSHVAHFAQSKGLSNVTYQTNDGSANHEMFQKKWPEYEPNASKHVTLTQVDKNPLR